MKKSKGWLWVTLVLLFIAAEILQWTVIFIAGKNGLKLFSK